MTNFVNNDVSSGAIVYASDHNTQGTLIAGVLNGGIENANISSSAAIATSKLADDAGITAAKLANASVTPAKLSNTYKFAAYRSSALSLANGTTKVPFDTEEYDTGSNFDTTTNVGRFTAPIAGFYRFSTAVGILTSGNFVFNVQLYKNGSNFKTFNQIKTGGSNASTGGSITVQLAANDYIEVYALSTDGGANNANVGSANTWFCGEIISAT